MAAQQASPSCDGSAQASLRPRPRSACKQRTGGTALEDSRGLSATPMTAALLCSRTAFRRSSWRRSGSTARSIRSSSRFSPSLRPWRSGTFASATSTSSRRLGTRRSCGVPSQASILAQLPASLNLLRPGANTVQNGGVIFLTTWLKYELRRMYGFAKLPPIVQVGHHDAHAAIFFASPFEEAAVLVMDGYGDASATSTYIGSGNRLEQALARRVLRLARHALHLRHLSPGLRAVRGGHGDGARRLRRRHLRGPSSASWCISRRVGSSRSIGSIFATTATGRSTPSPASSTRRSVRRGGATSPSPTATAIWRSPCRPPPRTWCCTSRARWPQLTRRATCASLEALPSTAWPTPASCATPTTETSGCRPAPPTPARRSAAPVALPSDPRIARVPSR